jgi:trehalose 6-phosphate synthase
MSAMRRYLTRHDILAWARDYLRALDHTGQLAAQIPKQRRRAALSVQT